MRRSLKNSAPTTAAAAGAAAAANANAKVTCSLLQQLVTPHAAGAG
jgi:hypothetical protein